MGEKQHARFSPSRLENLEICPKFEMQEMEDSADEGTLMHEAAEKEDLSGLSEEQRTQVQAALDYKSVIVSKRPNAKVLKEERVELQGLTYGTLDLAVVWDDEADIADYKFGRVEVEHASRNLQVQTYAAALMEMRPELQKVTVHIIQPRVGTPSFATFDRSLVAQIRARIELVYSKTGDPFSPPCPGAICDRCRWAHRCPALKPALVQASETFGMPVPEVLRGEVPATPEDRYKLQMLAILFEKVAEQWKESNKKAWFEEGVVIPGLVVQERSSGPRVRKEFIAAAMRKLRDEGYANEDQILNCLKISIPDLAKQMVEIRGGTEKEERARILEILEGMIVESSSRFLAKAPKPKGKKE
jgi:hypothetical protein